MDEAYQKFIEHEQAVKQAERKAGIFTITTWRSKPNIKHLATGELGGWMKTMCGRKVINYWYQPCTSDFYTDGSRYAQRCPICFTHEGGLRQ